MAITRRTCVLGLGGVLAGGCVHPRKPRRPTDDGASTVTTRLTHLSTATVLIEVGPLRLLTDPAFDPAGTRYDFGLGARSVKLDDTAVGHDELGKLDMVLVTHDQHGDNLDHLGRELLTHDDVARVITTMPGRRRLSKRRRRDRDGLYSRRTGLGLGDKLVGLRPWDETTLDLGGRSLRIVATPAKHGPSATPKVRQVLGFALHGPGLPCIFISGDTVWFKHIEQLRRDLDVAGVPPIDVALIHCGAVQFPDHPLVGRARFTFDAADAVRMARDLSPRFVVPVHYDGWEHFGQPRAEAEAVFAADAMIGPRVVWLTSGQPWTLPPPLKAGSG